MLHLKPPSMPLIATVRATAVSEIIDYNPAPVPGPVVSRRSALEALSSSRVDSDLDAAAVVRRFPAFRALEVVPGAPAAQVRACLRAMCVCV